MRRGEAPQERVEFDTRPYSYQFAEGIDKVFDSAVTEDLAYNPDRTILGERLPVQTRAVNDLLPAGYRVYVQRDILVEEINEDVDIKPQVVSTNHYVFIVPQDPENPDRFRYKGVDDDVVRRRFLNETDFAQTVLGRKDVAKLLEILKSATATTQSTIVEPEKD